MKMRIRGDTLRLRLTRGEVDALGSGAAVEECTPFPDGSTLRYRLVAGTAFAASQSATAGGHVVIVEVPRERAAAWAASDEVGVTGAEPFSVGPLNVLIEKDFTCITPRAGEEELDTFPNPAAQQAG